MIYKWFIERDSRAEHGQLIQKKNEYVHRREQLERYNTGFKTPAATHPDAKKHRLYDIPDSSIITTPTTPPPTTTITTTATSSDEEEDDKESEKIRLFLQKAQVIIIIIAKQKQNKKRKKKNSLKLL